MRIAAAFGAMAMAWALAGCASLNFTTANALRAVDVFSDDIASLVLAIDLPDTLAPIAEGSTVTVEAKTPASGERRIEAVLVHADTELVVETLPEPGRDRAYYLFGFSDEDKARLREMQEWGRGLGADFGATGGTVSVSVSPGICRTTDIDPNSTYVSVLIALPGGDRLEPLVNNARLSELLAGTGAPEVPHCGEV